MDFYEPPPKKCSPPKYLNTDLGPDGKEQQCKEGTSTDIFDVRKCRQLSQQQQQPTGDSPHLSSSSSSSIGGFGRPRRSTEDDLPNPASSGGMAQFFKDKFYDVKKAGFKLFDIDEKRG